MITILVTWLLLSLSLSSGCVNLCPYKDDIPNPEAIIVATRDSPYAGMTCSEVESSTPFQSIENGRDCLGLQVNIGIKECWCPPPSCTECPRGFTPVGTDCDAYRLEMYYEQLGFELGVFVENTNWIADEEACPAFRFLMTDSTERVSVLTRKLSRLVLSVQTEVLQTMIPMSTKTVFTKKETRKSSGPIPMLAAYFKLSAIMHVAAKRHQSMF